jgi:hypothetical protein
MPNKTMKRAQKTLPPLILVGALLAVYLASMAPGLSWANGGADGGDLISAAATGGVAHPTGYPLYLLLARLFLWLPVGSLAYRTNMMSAVAAVLAALLVFSLVTRSVSSSTNFPSWLAGLASGFAIGLSPLFWSQAVITEVYSLHAMFVALLLFLSIGDLSTRYSQKYKDLFLGLAFGLAMGNHITSILLLPLAFSGIVHRKPAVTQGNRFLECWQLDIDIYSLIRRVVFICVGLMVFLTLPLRALSHPPVNWGNPITLGGLGWLISGKLYQGQLFNLTVPAVWEHFHTVVSLFLQQFGVIGLASGLIGLIVFFKPTRLYFYTLWILVASCAFALVYVTTDAYIYLIPAVLCFAIWIGMGLGAIMGALSNRFRILASTLGLILTLVILIQAVVNWPKVDASRDQRAELFAQDVLSLAPQDAIIFASGDRAVFTMWYFQYALNKRLDLAIIAVDLLHFDWYQQTLHSTYPNLLIPAPFPFSETVVSANPRRPVCNIQYIHEAEIKCTPARNP